MADEKIKIPKTKVLPSDSKITSTVTPSVVPGTTIETYTFPAQQVPNTNKPKLATFYNPISKEVVTVDQNASMGTKLNQAFGAGGDVQGGLYLAENIAKGITVKSAKGMVAVVLTRMAVSTLKYHYGTSQKGWVSAIGSGIGTNIKLSTAGYFHGLKVPPKFQKKFDEIVEYSHFLHVKLDQRTISPIKNFGNFTIGGVKGNINPLDLQFGANRIEAKYFNLKTGTSAIGSGINGVKTMFGIGQSNGTHSNSESETHPQNSIASETYKNAKEASNPTNIVKVVTTAQTDVPTELESRVLGNKKYTPNEKLLFQVRYKRKWVIANAIADNKDFVEIAPKVYLDLKKYDAPKEIVDAVKWVEFERNPNQKAKPMTGSPGGALGLGGTVSKIALAVETIYEVGKQFYSIAEVLYKSNYGQTDEEAKSQALAQQRLQLIAAGGKEVKNADGSVTITFDITKQKQSIDNAMNKGKNIQLNFALEQQVKQAKIASDRKNLFDFAEQQRKKGPNTYSQINNGLGVNTQRGPQTGIFGQNLGWTKGN